MTGTHLLPLCKHNTEGVFIFTKISINAKPVNPPTVQYQTLHNMLINLLKTSPHHHYTGTILSCMERFLNLQACRQVQAACKR